MSGGLMSGGQMSGGLMSGGRMSSGRMSGGHQLPSWDERRWPTPYALRPTTRSESNITIIMVHNNSHDQ